ncbi:glycosyl hydrolase family 2 [Anseongella ginsenosidimutans]|uniref:Glycosyl hydrolase family 2 n=1 Tax=Anseongella ginsenosidimutans TaxID=496056 RepID=A0A4R3KWS4_9SPHI|nr:sugar-binding domain-containing protein [Anseongella ginsenosidimutans]QEC51237.1 beta-galactosidase [Anseongella ginsenosidimutans]TCS90085.1 glycosyl hydrolase family 2 [Anseongella ginsenosidimutans]
MRKRFYTLAVSALVCQSAGALQAQDAQWKIAGDKITTEWAADVDPAAPLPEYPRPQMVRENWANLNGLWDYAIKASGAEAPAEYDGKILVPFAVESALSGVAKRVGKDNDLWYRTSFTVPRSMRKQQVLLHFGAVDWQAEVFVNGKKAGEHKGGYDPFSFDITELLDGRGEQELLVKVWDPTNDGPQPRGKQVKDPEGIWYTPVTGIWQTVWLEGVPETHIAAIRNTPDVDNSSIHVAAELENGEAGQLRVSVYDKGNKIAEETIPAGSEATIKLDDPALWSPSNPYLYDLKIELLHKNKVVDAVDSYFALRKITMEKDAAGIQRMLLNGEFLFQYGPLDQGWWPDGLYTAPTDEALVFDIEKTKEMGFNMIRKHVKVEPARWYYHCDQLGMLVWQDMPSGDLGNQWNPRPGVTGVGTEKDRTAESEAIFRTEWKAIMDANYNFPSIVVWVPFNEAWGQFKTEEITRWTMEYDPTRLVNSASGGNFHPVGHIIDLHNYPEPVMPRPDLFGSEQIIVLGEFGGLGLPLEGHTWQQKDNWGYRSFDNKEALLDRYAEYMQKMQDLIAGGLSAAVYTQTTDVEVEVNGLMTYDRKVIKLDPARLKSLHQPLYKVKVQ